MKKPKRWNEVIARLPKNGTLIEVGVWKGECSFHVLDARSDAKAILVDPWESGSVDDGLMKDSDWLNSGSRMAKASQYEIDLIFQKVAARAAGYGKRCKILRLTSEEAARKVPDATADLVFIDAIHTYDALKSDIDAWLNKVKPGGIIGGHDYDHERFPGVKQAVVEAFGETSTQTGADHCWFVQL